MVDKDIGQNLEVNIRKRKEFILRDDLDNLQKDFIEKKEKCDVHIKKLKQETPIQIAKPSEIKKVKGKKKIKDVITLDIPLNQNSTASSKKEKESLFGLTYDDKPQIINKEQLDKETGLPSTFKLESYEKKTKVLTPSPNLSTFNPTREVKEDKPILPVKENAIDYNEVNKSNIEAIKKMSKQEIEEMQKEIMKKIPSSLLKKMKAGYFQNKLKNELTSKSKPKVNTKEEIVFNYEGTAKKTKESVDTNTNSIDFTHLKFDDIDLSKKFFSLFEVYNLLSSSNPIQITLGLKILFNLITKKLYKEYEDFAKQLYSFINALYFLIDHSNLNVRKESLKCFVTLLKDFFYEDYKLFKFNLCEVSHYPVQLIYHTKDSLSKTLSGTKDQFIQLIKNNNKDYYYLIVHNDNIEIIDMYKTILFYVCYINGELPKDIINKMINENTLSKFTSNQKLMKIMVLLGDKNDVSKLSEGINNKYYAHFIYDLRGVNVTINLQENEKDSHKNKVYSLNKQLLTSLENGTLIMDEKDEIIMSKLLKLNMNISLRKVYSDDATDNPSFITNDLQIKILEDKFNDCVNYIKDNLNKEIKSIYYQIIPKITYMSTFLLFWHKCFKYPKIIGYKKIHLTLDDIINLYPIINKILETILKYIHTAKSNEELIEKIYIFESFLVLCLNYIRCFIKNYDSKCELQSFPLFLIRLSELINKGDEYYYNQYMKYIKNIIARKYEKYKTELDTINLDFNSIDVDLNFYLESNEELRRSTYCKKVFMSSKTNDRIDKVIFETNTHSSKYFPFDNNFIYQIIVNPKAKNDIKINYLLILLILSIGEKDSSTYISVSPFEIALRFMMSFNTNELSIFECNQNLRNIYEKYINYVVLGKQINTLTLSNTQNNKLLMNNYLMSYEDNMSLSKNKILCPLLILNMLYLHSDRKSKDFISSSQYLKNIEIICYENMNVFLSEPFLIKFDNEENMIKYMIDNMALSYTSLYQTIILTYLKYYKKEREPINIMEKYIRQLMHYFGITTQDSEHYLKNESSLKTVIYDSLHKKI